MKKIFIALLSFFALPFFVNAATTATLECDKESVIIGNSFSCNVIIDPEEAISSFKTNIYYSTDFTLTSITPATNWQSNSTTLLDVSNSNYSEGEGLLDKTTIATLKFRVNSNITSYGLKTIKISGISLTSEVTDTINILSNNNLLSSLVLSDINFDFTPTKNTYTLTTAKSSVGITASVMDTNSVLKNGYGSRTVNLNYGKNVIQVIVISQNNTTNTYTINIERLDQRSSNNSLKSLKVTDGIMTPAFDKDILTYNVSVSTDVSNVNIEATKDVSSSSYVANYGPRTVDLQDGLNTYTIQVKAENGVIKTYTLNIIKSEKSSNNFLKGIALSNANIDFNKNTLQYEINVLYDVLEMEITAVPEDISAKVEVIGTKSLIIGANVYTVNVVAQNGSILTYKIIVNRLEEGRKLSDNNFLNELVISNYALDFNKDILEYSLKIKDEERLSISYGTEDVNANVKLIGNNALKNNSKIRLVVTSESGIARTYTINILKEEKSTTTLLYIVSGALVIIILALLIFKDKIFKSKDNQLISQDIKLNSSKLVLKSDSKEIIGTPEVVNIPDEPKK